MMTTVMTRQERDDAHNGEEDDEDGDDGHDARVLAGLGILKQEPDAPGKSNCKETKIKFSSKESARPSNVFSYKTKTSDPSKIVKIVKIAIQTVF